MSYQKIQNALDDHDHKAFLIQYFETIYSGVDLPIPSGLEMDRIQQGWKKIFDEVIEIPVPDAFVQALSQEWHAVINKQGGKVDDSFIIEILAILTGKTPPKKQPKSAIQSQTNNSEPPKSFPSSKQFYPRRSKTGERRDLPPLDDESVDAAISQTYRDDSEEPTPDMPSLTANQIVQIKENLYKHYTNDDAHGFLIDFFRLSFTDNSKCKPPALSGESWQIFQTHWQDIFLLLLDRPGHEAFIQKLHPIWLATYQKLRRLPDTKTNWVIWLNKLQETYSKPTPKQSWAPPWIQTIKDYFRLFSS